jgi:hypothetical protein
MTEENFTDDPDYKKMRQGVMMSQIGAGLLGMASMGLVYGAVAAVTMLTGPVAIGVGIAAGIGALFAGYKSWEMSTDAMVGYEEINARRTAYHLAAITQSQPSRGPSVQQEQEFTQNVRGDGKSWVQTVAADKAMTAGKAPV